MPSHYRGLEREMIRAGEEQIRQMMSAIFFQVLVLALVPFTYMCAQILTQITTSAFCCCCCLCSVPRPLSLLL